MLWSQLKVTASSMFKCNEENHPSAELHSGKCHACTCAVDCAVEHCSQAHRWACFITVPGSHINFQTLQVFQSQCRLCSACEQCGLNCNLSLFNKCSCCLQYLHIFQQVLFIPIYSIIVMAWGCQRKLSACHPVVYYQPSDGERVTCAPFSLTGE